MRPVAAFLAVVFLGGLLPISVRAQASARAGQTPTMPSTLRYGSGLMDVPVSSVLPHLQVTGTLSAFKIQLGRRVLVDADGLPAGFGPGRDDFMKDGSVAVGLFDRAEAGFTIQSLADADEGGSLWGFFGRVRLWEPIDQGVGLAVGGRYLTSPSYAGGGEYSPGRLGFPDERLRPSYGAVRGMHTNTTLYAVATAYLRGYDGGRLPKNDITFSLGYGGGMFSQGGGLDFYADRRGGGWFGGASLHVETSQRSVLTLMAEHNGFDVNVGAQYDWAGLRVGAQILSTNHHYPVDGHVSEYLKPRFGLLASIAVCPGLPGLRCTPKRMRRTVPDTIILPPPPPDTVLIAPVEPTRPEGEDAAICLSTGRSVPILITAQADTLVGPAYASLRELRPGLEFEGSYAGDAFWYRNGGPVLFEGNQYGRSDDTFPLDCSQVLRVGVYEGIAVFALISASRPFSVIFIPVRPGVWRRYERGLREE